MRAYAALRRDEEALEALGRVRGAKDGEVILEAIAKGHGPARELALRVLGRTPPSEVGASAYR
jgi:hypothetical protein